MRGLIGSPVKAPCYEDSGAYFKSTGEHDYTAVKIAVAEVECAKPPVDAYSSAITASVEDRREEGEASARTMERRRSCHVGRSLGFELFGSQTWVPIVTMIQFSSQSFTGPALDVADLVRRHGSQGVRRVVRARCDAAARVRVIRQLYRTSATRAPQRSRACKLPLHFRTTANVWFLAAGFAEETFPCRACGPGDEQVDGRRLTAMLDRRRIVQCTIAFELSTNAS